MASKPDLPEISPELMERFDKIERLRGLRTMLMVAGHAVDKAARCNLAQVASDAAELGIDVTKIEHAIDVLTASFRSTEKQAVVASLKLISDHRLKG